MFGALSATPQVAGLGIVDPSARVRRWGRGDASVVVEDWSAQPEIAAWLRQGRTQDAPVWSVPVWTHTIGGTVLVLGTPLRYRNRFLGMLAQIVPITEISRAMAQIQQRTRITPFVLHGRDAVLAHPLLAGPIPGGTSPNAPLPRIQELEDPMLQFVWNTEEVPYFLRGMTGLRASGRMVDERYRVFLHREIAGYGPGTWTVGVHFDAKEFVGDEPRRIAIAFGLGVGLLLIALVVAVVAGRRLSLPVRVLAEAAAAVQDGRFGAVPALPRSRVRELDAAMGSFRQMVDGLRERQLIRDVLGRFVPEEVARTLLTGGGSLPVEKAHATLLFCDLEGFTALTERVGPGGIFDLLNEYFEAMVAILERHEGIVTQFQGDAILATFNVPVSNPRHAANALEAALEMQRAVRERRFAGRVLSCRIGINTGPVVAGPVGAKGRLSYTVHGDAVNLAARLEALNKEHGTRILVSAHTARLVSGFELQPVGEVAVRGQSQPVRLFSLQAAPGSEHGAADA
jgi:class 3 adenylate cyclase